MLVLMIDCHAHAFPTLAELSSHLPATAQAFLASSTGQTLKDVGKNVLSQLPKSSRLGKLAKGLGSILPAALPKDSAELAHLREKLPGNLHKSLEYFMSAGTGPKLLLEGTVDKLINSMDRNGIKKTVLIGAPPLADAHWILKTTQEHSGRFIPVLNVPPIAAESGEKGWLAAFEELADLGARGFKIHPNMDPYHHHHLAYQAMFQVAKARDLFIILHTGCFTVPGYKSLKPSEPEDFTHLFTAYPKVKVCLAHMNRDHPERAWDMMKKHAQIYTDTSWQPAANINRALHEVGSDRILLGSDWPLLNDELQDNAVREMRSATSDHVFEKLTEDNAKAFLGEP